MNNTVMKNTIERCGLMLGGLCIYRNLLADPVIAAFRELASAVSKYPDTTLEICIDKYSEFFNKLSRYGSGLEGSINRSAERSTGLCGSSTLDFSIYVFDRVLLDENPFTLSAAQSGKYVDPGIRHAAFSDLQALRSAVSVTSSMIKEVLLGAIPDRPDLQETVKGLPDWAAHRKKQTPEMHETAAMLSEGRNTAIDDLMLLWGPDTPVETIAEKLEAYHRENGSGILTRKYAFTWQRRMPDGAGCLVPVRNPDPVRLSDLVAYESEREEVVRNTEQFLHGYAANNVLLYGDRGTGKSSTVKALLNEYAGRGLRMVEVPKHLLTDFPEIIALLAERPHKFIVFVDDLSFEDSEDSYTALKAVIEGGLEVKPDNVLIYATSNRRHLVRESFSDRLGLQSANRDDEIRAIDTMQEKLSLSDRFGITVVFASPDKKRFLDIVDKLAQKRGIDMDSETLHKEALKWELWYNGRSPRTAQQFINHIAAENK